LPLLAWMCLLASRRLHLHSGNGTDLDLFPALPSNSDHRPIGGHIGLSLEWILRCHPASPRAFSSLSRGRGSLRFLCPACSYPLAATQREPPQTRFRNRPTHRIGVLLCRLSEGRSTQPMTRGYPSCSLTPMIRAQLQLMVQGEKTSAPHTRDRRSRLARADYPPPTHGRSSRDSP